MNRSLVCSVVMFMDPFYHIKIRVMYERKGEKGEERESGKRAKL